LGWREAGELLHTARKLKDFEAITRDSSFAGVSRGDSNVSPVAEPTDVTATLEGVRRGRPLDPSSPVARALAREGRIVYSVTVRDDPGAKKSHEKRRSVRQRTRLRSAKLLDANNRFLCECLIQDHSTVGLKIKLMKNVSLPARFRLFDDETGEVRTVAVAWRRDAFLGGRFCLGERSPLLSKSARAALTGRYYAMTD
jgi:hypothetical protein